MPENELSIGELAAAAGVSVQAVRFYERRGLLARPRRRPSGHRVYGPESIDRLWTIKQAQRIGFTLNEIDELLKLSQRRKRLPEDLQEHLKAKLAAVEEKMQALAEMKATLLDVLHADCVAVDHCTDPSCPFWQGDASMIEAGRIS